MHGGREITNTGMCSNIHVESCACAHVSQVSRGKGFHLVRGFPVAQFKENRVGLVLAFWSLALHLGRPLVRCLGNVGLGPGIGLCVCARIPRSRIFDMMSEVQNALRLAPPSTLQPSKSCRTAVPWPLLSVCAAKHWCDCALHVTTMSHTSHRSPEALPGPQSRSGQLRRGRACAQERCPGIEAHHPSIASSVGVSFRCMQTGTQRSS